MCFQSTAGLKSVDWSEILVRFTCSYNYTIFIHTITVHIDLHTAASYMCVAAIVLTVYELIPSYVIVHLFTVTGRSKGYGFVEFKHLRDAEDAYNVRKSIPFAH